MKIITKAIEKAFIKQGDTSQKEMKDINIIMKLFNPCGGQTWYVFEKIDEDIYRAFVNLGDYQNAEIGNISMSEILSIKLMFGLKVERDLHFRTMSLEEVYNKVKSGQHV